MPRVPDKFAHSVGFLYPTVADAENNTKRGGSCFMIGRIVKDEPHPHGGNSYFIYAVTNFHVAWTAGAPVLRLNRRDGRKHIIKLVQGDWIPHPNGDDLAIAFLSDRINNLDSVDRALDHLTFVEESKILTEEAARRCALGPGDDVFMIGRFLNHQGTDDKILPALRFGNISVMPEPIWNSVINADQLSFAVEMRSRTGFSGSLVATYRTPMNSVFTVPAEQNTFLWILGVNWGYITEKGTGENTWLNGVIPAWKILELLEVPALRDKHDKSAADLKRWREHFTDAPAVPASADDISSPASGDANPHHLEDFDQLQGRNAELEARNRELEEQMALAKQAAREATAGFEEQGRPANMSMLIDKLVDLLKDEPQKTMRAAEYALGKRWSLYQRTRPRPDPEPKEDKPAKKPRMRNRKPAAQVEDASEAKVEPGSDNP
jgi:hypothetical protein